MVIYRGIEYAVVQGIGRQVWKWSASGDEVVIRGIRSLVVHIAALKYIFDQPGLNSRAFR